ncbi:MAG: MGMT family protein [Gammaproteobacteria bacterium]|nr:MGMT family protein [Gammaproteobacteria bacterium]
MKTTQTKTEKAQALVWHIVFAIPKGKVATYGQIATMAGLPEQSRMVGRILSRLPKGSKIPWHRVINSQGKISNPNPSRQQQRLEADGITLVNGRVQLTLHQWKP